MPRQARIDLPGHLYHMQNHLDWKSGHVEVWNLNFLAALLAMGAFPATAVAAGMDDVEARRLMRQKGLPLDQIHRCKTSPQTVDAHRFLDDLFNDLKT